jgi:uncharacterized protein YcaQ
MTLLQMTRDEARWIATIAQGLDRRPFSRKVRKLDLIETIERLGCVQLDTISVISRSHETVLWSRLGPYDTNMIVELYDPDLLLTEYWAHAAAIVPTSMLPLFRGTMENYGATRDWHQDEASQLVTERILERIRECGPVSSRDFEPPEGSERASAWDWYGNKIERLALNELWTSGQLIVRKREKSFARVYDLPERVAPDLWTADAFSQEYRQRSLLSRAVRALGVFTATWAADYFRSGRLIYLSVKDARDLLAKFEREGRIIRVEVPGIKDPTWIDVARLETLDLLRQGKGRPTLTTFLSPFDNLAWNRNRDALLWDFEYRLECYTPAPKRIYGYYTLPILHRGRLIGRMEPSYDRRAKVLTIKSLHLEPGTKATPPLVAAILRAIEDLVQFLGGAQGSWRILEARPMSVLGMFESSAA